MFSGWTDEQILEAVNNDGFKQFVENKIRDTESQITHNNERIREFETEINKLNWQNEVSRRDVVEWQEVLARINFLLGEETE